MKDLMIFTLLMAWALLPAPILCYVFMSYDYLWFCLFTLPSALGVAYMLDKRNTA